MRQIGSRVRSVKFLLCPTSASSKPALDFFTSSYTVVKHLNPVLPYMIRAAPGKPPLMVVEFDFGEKAHVPLAGLDTAGVERKVRFFCATYRPGPLHGARPSFPAPLLTLALHTPPLPPPPCALRTTGCSRCRDGQGNAQERGAVRPHLRCLAHSPQHCGVVPSTQ